MTQANGQAPTEQIERKFSKAQMRHFNKLQTEMARAQAEAQKFTDYLSDELDLDAVKLPDGYAWGIGPNGFVAVPQQGQVPPPQVAPPPPDGESQEPATGSEGGAGMDGETQTPSK